MVEMQFLSDALLSYQACYGQFMVIWGMWLHVTSSGMHPVVDNISSLENNYIVAPPKISEILQVNCIEASRNAINTTQAGTDCPEDKNK